MEPDASSVGGRQEGAEGLQGEVGAVGGEQEKRGQRDGIGSEWAGTGEGLQWRE